MTSSKKIKFFKVVNAEDLEIKRLTIRPYDPGLEIGERIIVGYKPATVVAVIKKRVSELTEKHARLAGCRSLKHLKQILRYAF